MYVRCVSECVHEVSTNNPIQKGRIDVEAAGASLHFLDGVAARHLDLLLLLSLWEYTHTHTIME